MAEEYNATIKVTKGPVKKPPPPKSPMEKLGDCIVQCFIKAALAIWLLTWLLSRRC